MPAQLGQRTVSVVDSVVDVVACVGSGVGSLVKKEEWWKW